MTKSGIPAPTAARYIRSLCHLLASDATQIEDLLAGTFIDAKDLQTAERYVNHDALDRFLINIEQQTGEQFPGLLLGHHLNVSAHGAVGYAGLTAPNAATAIDVASQYFPLITSLVSLKVAGSDLIITPAAGISERAEQFVLQTLLASFDVMGSFLVGNLGLRADLCFAKQPELRNRLGNAIEYIAFDRPQHRFSIPESRLKAPFALADETSHMQAMAQCEKEYHALQTHSSLAGQVRQLMTHSEAPPGAQEAVARSLGMSPRTLHRRLREEGSSFRSLAQQAMIQRARHCLIHQGLSVTETAYRLGYRDSANFTRAFRKATGSTPSSLARED